MTRRPLFWVLFSLGSLACAGYAWRVFPTAFPLISLDLRMDRQQALAIADSLAVLHEWGPPAPGPVRQAASFDLDEETQTFVELEGGGKEAFTQMLREGLYEAYTWQVRRFRPGEANETVVRFTPAGRPYGFEEKLKETAPGPTVSPDSARALAEREVQGSWGLDLGPYTLVEQSQEVRPGGRTDHTLVYQRAEPRLGEGRYRLRLVVSGDRLTELTHFVKVPEAFTRRYDKLRSANRAIAFAAVVVLGVLYLLGACLGGVILLLRRRWLLWRPAVIAGVGVAFAQLLGGLNAWPLVWMQYDTALSDGAFVLQQVAVLLGEFVGTAGLFGLTFLAAEGLSRRAFPHHPQLWKLWSSEAAGSPEVLGRTAGGYLMLGYDLAYLVGFYLFTTRVLGWWNPSESLAQPDVLAHYLPWYSSLAIPLQAGFWEESLFRAVPLASAALLGDRFGGRRWWILGGLLLEALVFGGGHATYSAQPAYARVVELIGPSLLYGLVYLNFGLLPVILVHFSYDAALFSLPLFVSSAPGIALDRALLVLLALTPLWLVLVARIRAGRWIPLSPALRNGAWRPPEGAAPAPAAGATPPVPAGITRRSIRLGLAAGVIGLVVWLRLTPFVPLPPRLHLQRADAIARAQATLAERGVRLPPRFRWLATVLAEPDAAHRFVWQTAGAARYRDLLGTYLDPPRWLVRAVSFEGDVAERAEEWRVELNGEGGVIDVRHELPESRPGARLDEGAARAVADSLLRARFGGGLDRFKEVSLTPTAHPERRDWLLVAADTTSPGLPQGERRLAVSLGGAEVTGAGRFVHVAEEWERSSRNREIAANLVDFARLFLLAIGLMTGAVHALVRWSRREFPGPFTLKLTALLAVVGVLSVADLWPAAVAGFSSAEPFGLQAAILLVGRLLAAILLAFGIALLAGLGRSSAALPTGSATNPDATTPRGGAPRWLGPALGAMAAGLLALADRVPAASEPVWPGYGGAAGYAPWLAAGLSGIPGFALRTALLIWLVTLSDRVSGRWARRRLPLGLGYLLLGVLLVNQGDLSRWPLWLAAGLAIGACLLWLYAAFLRFDRSLAVPIVATVIGLDLVRVAAQRNYPGAAVGAGLSLAFIAALAWWWWSWLARAGSPA
jgi:hypothetical protein